MPGCVLVVETSTRQASIALVIDREEQIYTANLDPEIPHDRDLLPAIENLLAAHKKRPEDLSGFLLGRGPGSFTGLRVGAATVLGLQQALSVPVLGRPSLEATAWAVLRTQRACSIVLDARRGSFFVARYARGAHDAMEEIMAPHLCAGDALSATIPREEPIWTDRPDLLLDLCAEERNPICNDPMITGPTAANLWRAAAWRWPALIALQSTPPGQLQHDLLAQLLPLYLRVSSPEEKRAQESGSASSTS